jgi:hypothetical protein
LGFPVLESLEWIGAITPETEQNLLTQTPAVVCMSPPDKLSLRDIDLFRVGQVPFKPHLSLPPAIPFVPRRCPRRYHSIQVAVIIGVFACGGLICSMFLVDGSDDFQRPRYWPRKSYSSPALATPQSPAIAPAVPRSEPFKSNGDEKKAALQDRRIGDRNLLATSRLPLASAALNSCCAADSFQGRSGRISPEISVTTG